ncbi:MAG: TlyA family RNA methyltransferase [Candidatus Heimdallarchaeota archaeon]
MKKRLDIYLVERRGIESRSRAQQLIRGKHVNVNGELCTKTGKLVDDDSSINVDNILKYVSRGGNKLEYALTEFNINVEGKIVADIGSSTGGFTDCLLKRGAAKVYSIDIAKGQLRKKLQEDPRVVYIDNKDIRDLKYLPNREKVDIATIDISLHSLESILSSVKELLRENGEIVALIKPQFELRKQLVSDRTERKKALYNVISYLEEFELYPVGLVRSPLRGGLKDQGNIEYLLHLSQESAEFNAYKRIDQLIAEER